ncbi:hypothetical protein RMATCC62417_17731 [Rhizopus microsporus]|nr:hypothetical protein RMATCC62417_17731 [Rhizopus microsporus]
MKSVVILLFYMILYCLTVEAIKIKHRKFKETSSDIIPGRYIITFQDQKDTAGTFFSQSLHAIKNLKVNQRFSHKLFNGLSVNLSFKNEKDHKSSLLSLLDRPDIKYVYPVRVVRRPKVFTKKLGVPGKKEPSALPHQMSQVDIVHSKLKNKGKGILIAVLDSGVDYMHPALGQGFGKGFKVSKGYDLVGDMFTGTETPEPDDDPIDNCGPDTGSEGHGTHVSGIIAGWDPATNFTGVAPEANLAMYRIFGCVGNSATDVILKGLLMAYDSGADIINLSLGYANAWSENSDVIYPVLQKILARGIHVVAAAGNDGEKSIYSIGNPAISSNAYAVASIENEYKSVTDLRATGISHPILYSGSESSRDFIDGELVFATEDQDDTSAACDPDQILPTVKGKIAMIPRGNCGYLPKAKNAAAAGAIGVVFIGSTNALGPLSVKDAPIPCIMISLKDGQALLSALKSRVVKISMNKMGHPYPVTNGGLTSKTTSVGPTAELDFKPDIAAVGGTVFSTLPRYLKSWGIMSGTSMATPYVSGSIALYLVAKGKQKDSIKYIQEQFQNYAIPSKAIESSDLDIPIRIGAGLIQVYDAITQSVHITPGKISFNDTSSNAYRTQTLTIKNYGSQTIQYELLNVASVGLAPYDVKESGYAPTEPAKNVNATASLCFSIKKFKLPPGKTQTVKVTVTPPKTDPKEHIFYGGYIVFKSKQPEIGKDISVPYFGKQGRQRDLPIIDNDYPKLVDASGKEFGPNDTFTYDHSVKNSSPTIRYRLLTPTAVLKIELIDMSVNKVIGTIQADSLYVNRHYQTGDRYESKISWPGTYLPPGSAPESEGVRTPAGTYKLRVSALKLFGNRNTPGDWETWTSCSIVLKNNNV